MIGRILSSLFLIVFPWRFLILIILVLFATFIYGMVQIAKYDSYFYYTKSAASKEADLDMVLENICKDASCKLTVISYTPTSQAAVFYDRQIGEGPFEEVNFLEHVSEEEEAKVSKKNDIICKSIQDGNATICLSHDLAATLVTTNCRICAEQFKLRSASALQHKYYTKFHSTFHSVADALRVNTKNSMSKLREALGGTTANLFKKAVSHHEGFFEKGLKFEGGKKSKDEKSTKIGSANKIDNAGDDNQTDNHQKLSKSKIDSSKEGQESKSEAVEVVNIDEL